MENHLIPTQLSSRKDPSLRNLVKVELHRHLEGSVRLDTMLAIIEKHGLDLPLEREELRKLVQIEAEQPQTTKNFLSKFEIIRKLFVSPETIRQITLETLEDVAEENIRHIELKFTPAALTQAGSFRIQDVMAWVIEARDAAVRDLDLSVALIASVNRHEDVDLAKQVAELATGRYGGEIQGLDLAGNESEFHADPFREIFRAAGEAGLGISVHAGEWGGSESVRYALEQMNAARIGHGIRILEDPSVLQLARDVRPTFEVCLTSNLRSGIIQDITDHPLVKMIQSGLLVTLNSDDPALLGIDLTHEYSLAVDQLDLSIESLKGLNLTAAQASFLPAREARALEFELQTAYSLV